MKITNTHDVISDELIKSKSISALIYLINHGRELEFSIDGADYFISCNEAEKYVSIWNGKNEQSFDSIDELIENAIIESKPFIAAWKYIKIKTLF